MIMANFSCEIYLSFQESSKVDSQRQIYKFHFEFEF